MSTTKALEDELLVLETAKLGRNLVALGSGHYCSSTSDRRLL
jgi:hypothetical protein